MARPHASGEYFNGRYGGGENIVADMVTAFHVGKRAPQEFSIQRPGNFREFQPRSGSGVAFVCGPCQGPPNP